MTIGDPGLAEKVASSTSVDVVTLDLQHGDIALARVPDLIRAIELGGAFAMARLQGAGSAAASYLLDLGLSGLIMPTVSTSSAAREFVAATRYPPRGNRSHGPVRRAPIGSDDPVLWAMIETSDGVDNVAEIAATDGIDGLFVGPGDLGISLGIGSGQNRHEPEFLDAVDTIRTAADASGIAVGIHSTDAGYTGEMIEAGFDLVTVWVDAVTIDRSLKTVESLFDG